MNRKKGTGNKKHNWYVQNRQGEGKNSIGNGKANELTYMTHRHELRGEGNVGGWGYRAEGKKVIKKMGQL